MKAYLNGQGKSPKHNKTEEICSQKTDWSRNGASPGHAIESQLAKAFQKLNMEERISSL